MKIPNTQQNIEFDLPATIKRVGLKISGGADSAIVAYMLSKYVSIERPDISIIPITVVNNEKAYQEIFSKNIIDYCSNQNNCTFGDHQVRWCKSDVDYVDTQIKLLEDVYSKEKLDGHYTGITGNPPNEVCATFSGDLPADSNDRSAGDNPQIIYEGNKFRAYPLTNINKQGVRELYEYFDVLETLYPLTRSCEDITVDYGFECGVCFHCEERLWGFGK